MNINIYLLICAVFTILLLAILAFIAANLGDIAKSIKEQNNLMRRQILQREDEIKNK